MTQNSHSLPPTGRENTQGRHNINKTVLTWFQKDPTFTVRQPHKSFRFVLQFPPCYWWHISTQLMSTGLIMSSRRIQDLSSIFWRPVTEKACSLKGKDSRLISLLWVFFKPVKKQNIEVFYLVLLVKSSLSIFLNITVFLSFTCRTWAGLHFVLNLLHLIWNGTSLQIAHLIFSFRRSTLLTTIKAFKFTLVNDTSFTHDTGVRFSRYVLNWPVLQRSNLCLREKQEHEHSLTSWTMSMSSSLLTNRENSVLF